MLKLNKYPFVNSLIIALLLSSAVITCRYFGYLQAMELLTYDFLLKYRSDSHNPAPIVIIDEAESDIKRYGYPLSDQLLADILNALLALNPQVIGVDKYRDQAVGSGAEELNTVLQQHNNIYWIFFIGTEQQGHTPPPAVLKNSSQIGFNDMVNDADGVSRRGLLFMDDMQGNSYCAFALCLAMHYLANKQIYPDYYDAVYFRLGQSIFLPLQSNSGGYAKLDNGGYQFLLTYPHLHQHFEHFTITALLTQQIPAHALEHKIVLLGSMAPSLNDYKLFPNGEQGYGVELHAHIVDQLLQAALDTYPLMRYAEKPIEYSYIIFWGLLASMMNLNASNMLRLIFIILGGLLGQVLIAQQAISYGLWLPLLPASLAWSFSFIACIMWQSTQERAERRQLVRLFEQHVSKQVVSTLWDQRDTFFDQGGVRPDQLTATVLFTDLVNFTTLAESMPPLILIEWLNEYMDAMSTILIEENGMINKYIGDAIMAVFGVPIKRNDEQGVAQDAIFAVNSALRMAKRLQELNRQWQKRGLSIVGMRVGIYTGQLVAGTLGGRQRMEYTVIGDTVNIASRLESFNKEFALPTAQNPCRILIGESTWHYVHTHFHTKKIGACQLKGKHNSLNVYQVVTD